MNRTVAQWVYLIGATIILAIGASPWFPSPLAHVGLWVGIFVMGLSAGSRLERWLQAREWREFCRRHGKWGTTIGKPSRTPPS